MSKILLVGASGPLGRALTPHLAARGHEVTGVSRRGGPGTLKLDVTNPELVDSTLLKLKPDALIDLARPTLTGSDDDAVVTSAIAAHERFLHSCAAAGVENYILASSGAVYGTVSSAPHAEDEAVVPASAYARLKIEAEANLARLSAAGAFGGLALSLRIFNIYGPGFEQSLINRLVEHTQPTPSVVVSASFVRDYVHSVDVARCVAAALEGAPLSSPVLNVGTGVGTSNIDLLSLFPDAAYTESESPSTPSFSVADMTLTREILGFDRFVTIAQAVRDWNSSPARH